MFSKMGKDEPVHENEQDIFSDCAPKSVSEWLNDSSKDGEIFEGGCASTVSTARTEIKFLEKETGTSMSVFLKIHNKLRSKYEWYRLWHENPFSHLVHYILLASFGVLLIGITLVSVFGHRASEIKAASKQTWDSEAAWSEWQLDNLAVDDSGVHLAESNTEATISYASTGTATYKFTPVENETVDWLSANLQAELFGQTEKLEYSTDNILFTDDIGTIADSSSVYIRLTLQTADATISPEISAFQINYSRLPNKPTDLSFKISKKIISTSQYLTAGQFSDPDNDTHRASEWQITKNSGDYSSPLFDSGATTDKKSLTQIKLSQNLSSGNYYFRVRYQDSVGAWSLWSDECSFTVDNATKYSVNDNSLEVADPNEIIDKRTETTKTFNNGDGTYTLDAYNGIIHYKEDYSDPSSPWLDVNTSHYIDTPEYVLYDEMPSTVKVYKNKIGYEIQSRRTGETYSVELQSVDGNANLSLGNGSNGLISWADINPENPESRIQNSAIAGLILPAKAADSSTTKDSGNVKFEFEISQNGVRLWKTITGDDAPKNFQWKIAKTGDGDDLRFRDNPDAYEISDSGLVDQTKKVEIEAKKVSGDSESFVWQETAPQTNLKIDTDVTYYTDYYYTVDGYVYSYYGDGTWSGLRSASGSSSNYYDSYSSTVAGWESSYGQYNTIYRSIYVFDTSLIPDTNSVTAATFSVYGYSKQDDNGWNPSINVYSSSPSYDTSLTESDYGTLGSTAFSTAISYTNYSTSGYNSFALNSSGLAAVSKTGMTKLGIRTTADASNTAPGAAEGYANAYFGCYFSENGSNQPKLSVTYSLPVATWDGGGSDNNWSTAANWSSDTTPTSDYDVVFDSTSTKAATIDSGFTNSIKSLSINSGYTNTVTVGVNLTITDDVNLAAGTLLADSYTINVGGSWNNTGGTFTKGTSTIGMTGNYGTETINTNGTGDDRDFYNLTVNATSPVDDYTKLLMHMNGANESTTFTDEVGNSYDSVGSPIISTTQSKFGGSAGYFNGSSYLKKSSSLTDFDLTSNVDFTIDTWVYLDESMGSQRLIAGRGGGGASWSDTNGHEWILFTDTDQKLYFQCHKSGNSLTAVSSSSTVNLSNAWHHIAVVSSSGTITLYLDGSSVGSASNPGIAVTSGGTQEFEVGSDAAHEAPWNGYIDEFRISKGIARWTANFTPPTLSYAPTEYSLSANTKIQNNLTISLGVLNSNDKDVEVGNFIQSGGTFTAPGSAKNFTISGGWNHSGGTFASNSGTATFAGDALFEGSTTFNNLSATTAGKTLSFTSGTTQTVSGTLTITGSDESNIVLARSGGSGTDQWSINPTSASVDYVRVSNSNNLASSAISVAHGTDSGNNTNWSISGGVVAPTVTTQSASSIAATSATGNGNITATGGATADRRGFKYSTVGEQDDSDSYDAVGGYDAGAYTKGLSSLTANTLYYIRAYATNSAGTGYGSWTTFYTLANVPGTPTVATTSATSLTITISQNSNPAATTYAIYNVTLSKYVQANGSSGDTAAWQTYSNWGGASGIANTGLNANTAYYYEVKARNLESTETSFSSQAHATTSSAISISGTVYANTAKTSNVGANKTVAVSVNGGAIAGSAETNSSGAFTISNVVVSASSPIVVFVDEIGTEANLFTQVVDNSTNISGLELFTNQIVVQSQTASPITNGQIKTTLACTDCGSHIHFSNPTGSKINFDEGYDFVVASGSTFTPGAEIGTIGNLTVNGTLDLGSNYLTMTGDLDASNGTISQSGSTINFTNTSGAQTITAGTQQFGNVAFSNGGTRTIAGSMVVNGTFTQSGGTLDLTENPTLTMKSNITLSGGSIDKGSGTLTMAGDLEYMAATGMNPGNVAIGASPDTVTLTSDASYDSLTINAGDYLITDGYDVTVAGNVSILGTFDATSTGGRDSDISVAGNWTNSGTFTSTGSTVTLAGADASTQVLTGDTSFNNLTASTSSNSAGRTIQFAGSSTTTVTGTWTITGASGKVITLALKTGDSGSWAINPTAASVTYVAVSDSTNSGTSFCASYSSGSNNSGWYISASSGCSGIIQFSSSSGSGSESTTPVSIGITLSAAQPSDATVDYAVTGGTATGGGVDYTLASGTATITAETTSTSISLTIVDDSLDEDNETVIITLSNPTNATLGTSTYTYTINDNDATPTIAFNSTSSSGAESVTSVDLPVSLSAASGRTVTVNYAVTGGTATGGGVDYTLASGSLNFSAGDTTKNISLTIVNDTLNENDETITVTLSSPSNATLGTNTAHTYTILDNDNPPTVTLELSGSPLAENGGSATVTARLSTASGKDVTVHLSFSGTATNLTDYTRSDTTISIGAGTTSNAITLTGINNSLIEDNKTIIISIDSVDNATESGDQEVVATIVNDDSVSSSSSSVTLPTGKLLINSGAEKTNSLAVTLTISSASATKMKISNLSDLSDATWEILGSTKVWELKGADEGTKTVYLKLKDVNEKESRLISTSIVYEKTAEIDRLAPATPTNITAVSDNEKITLNWDNPTDNDFAKVMIFRSTVSNFAADTGANLLATTNSAVEDHYYDAALTQGTIYYYRLASVDTSGNVSEPSDQVSIRLGQETKIWSKEIISNIKNINSTISNLSSLPEENIPPVVASLVLVSSVITATAAVPVASSSSVVDLMRSLALTGSLRKKDENHKTLKPTKQTFFRSLSVGMLILLTFGTVTMVSSLAKSGLTASNTGLSILYIYMWFVNIKTTKLNYKK